MTHENNNKRVLRFHSVKEKAGLSRSTIYAMIKKGELPSPVQLSARCVGWYESDVGAWLEGRTQSNKQPIMNVADFPQLPFGKGGVK